MNKEVNGLMKQRRIARERCKEKDKEIERLNNIIEEKTYLYNKLSTESEYVINKLNNIIDELEKWLEEKQDLTCGCGITPEYIYAYENCLDKLKELKEGKNE